MSKEKTVSVKSRAVNNTKAVDSDALLLTAAQLLFIDGVLHLLEQSLADSPHGIHGCRRAETQTARTFECNDFTSEADSVLVWATAQPRRK